MMRKILFFPLLSLPLSVLAAPETVVSPDGDLKLNFEIRDGQPVYWVDFKGKEVIAPSRLGFSLFSETGRNSFERQGKKAGADALSLKDGFEISNVEIFETVDETWQPVWGEESEIRNHYNEMLVNLEQPQFDRKMNIRFRVYDEGFGLRYEFPEQPNLN